MSNTLLHWTGDIVEGNVRLEISNCKPSGITVDLTPVQAKILSEALAQMVEKVEVSA
tara:strand:- start:337 stop:507 length:171 start_codon:yes stop_codon:yes gene_type:complete